MLSKFSSSPSQSYTKVEADCEDGDIHSLLPQPRQSISKPSTSGVAFISILAFVLGALVGFGFQEVRQHGRNWSLKRINTYTPLLDMVELKLGTETVNGSLFNHPKSIYREEPSEKVDAAWEEIAKLEIFVIDGSDVSRLGKDPSKTVRAPEDWGYGSDAHLAQLDGQHMLHCLNVLRKFAFFEHYYGEEYGSEQTLHPLHVAHRSHCLHILLQALTCQPSLNVITHNWMDTQSFPFPDFNIERKCQDHGSMLDWQKTSEKVIGMDRWVEISERGPPAGSFVLPVLQDLIDIGVNNVSHHGH